MMPRAAIGFASVPPSAAAMSSSWRAAARRPVLKLSQPLEAALREWRSGGCGEPLVSDPECGAGAAIG